MARCRTLCNQSYFVRTARIGLLLRRELRQSSYHEEERVVKTKYSEQKSPKTNTCVGEVEGWNSYDAMRTEPSGSWDETYGL